MDTDDVREQLMLSAKLDAKNLNENEKVMLEKLLEKLGHLPLAATQAGAYIHITQSSVQQYYDLFVKRQLEVPEESTTRSRRLGHQEQILYTTCTLGFEQLSTHAKQLLLLIAFWHYDGIQKETFRRAADRISAYVPAGPPTDMEKAALEEVGQYLKLFETPAGSWNDPMFLNYVTELLALSLITFNQASQEYAVHPTVQVWARGAAPDRAMAVECSCLLLALSICWGDDTANRMFRRAMLPHVNAILAHTVTVPINYAPRFSQVYCDAGQARQKAKLGEEVLAVWLRELGVEHPNTLATLCNLALAYHELGELDKAETLGVAAVGAHKQALGDEHPNTLICISNLALTYFVQGRIAEADELDRSLLVIRKRTLGDEHPSTLRSMAHIAARRREQNLTTEAEELEAFVLDARKRVLGSDHPDTLETMSNLALTYQAQGRFNEAEELTWAALETRKRVSGDQHPNTLRTMGNLAAIYSDLGRLGEAETLEILVLDTRKRVLGEEHPDTLLAMSNLAVTYYAQGTLAEAESLGLHAMTVRERILGPNHPSTLRSMHNLAATYRAQGKQAEHDALMRRIEMVERQ